jgi:hypothetical protein
MLQAHNTLQQSLLLRKFHANLRMKLNYIKITSKCRLHGPAIDEFGCFAPPFEIDLMHGQTKSESC